MIGFGILAAGVIIVLVPIYVCAWCVLRRKEEQKDDDTAAFQLAQLYAEH
jgi:hypothetical protein